VLTRYFALCAFALSLSAADLSGIWSGTTVDRNGDVQDVSFRFIQKGDSLTGKVYGDNKSTPVSDARIEADHITFTVVTELNGQITKLVYSGTIVGDEMHLTRERTGNFAATKAKNPQNQKVSFTLKRVA
jgi:hypothetical protein